MPSDSAYHKEYQALLRGVKAAGYDLDEIMRYLKKEDPHSNWTKVEAMRYMATTGMIKVSHRTQKMNLPAIIKKPDFSTIPTANKQNATSQEPNNQQSAIHMQFPYEAYRDIPNQVKHEMKLEIAHYIWEQENLYGLPHNGGNNLPAQIRQDCIDKAVNRYMTAVRRNTLSTSQYYRQPYNEKDIQPTQDTIQFRNGVWRKL